METGDTVGVVRMRAINLAPNTGRAAGERPERDIARETPRGVEASVPAIRARLLRDIGPDQLGRYFGADTRLVLGEGRLDVVVGSGFLAQLLERRFGPQLKRATESMGRGGGTLEVCFKLERGAFEASPRVEAPARAVQRPVAAPVRGGDSFKYRFENFVVGRANRLACSAALRLAEDDGPVPLVFIHGTCGLGKTHLLKAAAARFQEKRPGAVVRFTSAEAFTNEFIQGVRAGKVDGFRKSYRRVDLLCLDDVHFFTNKEATQSELMHTLDAVGLDGARLLLASDEHPREISKLSERLVSRFLAGAVVKIEMPDAELREKLVATLAARRGMAMDAPAMALLAQRSGSSVGSLGGFGGSVREIEGLLNQVDAVHRLLPEMSSDGRIGVMLVRRALGLDEAPGTPAANSMRPRRPITGEAIVAEVCRELAVDLHDFMGKGRHKRVVLARSLVSSLSRRLTTLSFPEIARVMGRSNHSTIITAQRRVDKQLVEDTGRPLSAELAAAHAGRTLRELAEHLTRRVQGG